MEYHEGLSQWSYRTWIKFGTWISGFMMVVILYNWKNWSDALKVMAGIAALIPLHVIEEWVFPGGFNYQYNIFLYRSDQPDRYPMCRVSDMITNLGATFMYMIITCISAINGEVNNGVILGSILFCCLEFILHTTFGTLAYFKFKKDGKTTIYGPGSITAYFGFVPFGVILCYELQGKILTKTDYCWCSVVLGLIVCVWILLTENLIKKKDNKYFFETNGYYDRFLKKKDN